MCNRTIGNPNRLPRSDAPRLPGGYTVDQAGGVIVMGSRTRYYVKARTKRPRNRRTGHIRF